MNLAGALILYFVTFGPKPGQLTEDCKVTWQNLNSEHIATVICSDETRDYRLTVKGNKIHAAPSLTVRDPDGKPVIRRN